MTIICVAGMHRSGTSMVARMLNLCGVHLGEQKELLPAASDNPEGFGKYQLCQYKRKNIIESQKCMGQSSRP